MSEVFKTTTHYELGYRDDQGQAWWEIDHGPDGIWIAYNARAGIPAIDIRGRGDMKIVRDGLDARGYNEWPVLMRRVETTYYEAEEVA